MQLSELRTLLGELQQLDVDNQGGADPDASVLDAQLNRALRWIADQTECVYTDRAPLTLVESQAAYDIQSTTPKMLRVDQVIINGNRLRGLDGNYGLWTLSEVMRDRPGYLTYTDATPWIAFMRDEVDLILSPSPSAAMAALSNHYLVGPCLPAELASDTDEPAIPLQYHEHIAYVAAVFSSEPLAEGQGAWFRLEKYNARIFGDLSRLKSRSTQRRIPSNAERGKRSDWSSDFVL